MTDEALSASAMALYERLVTATALPIGEGGLSPDDPAVQELREAGFAEITDELPGRLLPIPPVAAFERVLTHLQHEFLDHQRQLLDAYTYLDSLQQRFLEAQPESDTESLAEIRPGESFVDAVSELIAGAEAEVLCWNIALQQLSIEQQPASRNPATGDSDSDSDDVGVLARTVYDTAFLHHEGGATVLRRARAAGEELRIADELASRMLIVDSTAVVLPLAAAATGALVIRSPLVVNAMREFFDLVWQRSVPWIDRESADELLTPIQRQVVALMAIGHGDDEVADHLGISLRTVRRHVADVMERLGADTRFAAGIAAARAGLLDDAALPPLGSSS